LISLSYCDPELAHNGRGLLFGGAPAAAGEAVSCPNTPKKNKRAALSYKPSAPLIASLCYKLALLQRSQFIVLYNFQHQ